MTEQHKTTVGELARQLVAREPSFDGDPSTIGQMIEAVIWFLDAFDVLAADLAARAGRAYVVRTESQDDQRALAVWFEQHPQHAADAWTAIVASRGVS